MVFPRVAQDELFAGAPAVACCLRAHGVDAPMERAPREKLLGSFIDDFEMDVWRYIHEVVVEFP